MNRYEIWAPWFVAFTGLGMMLIGLLCMGLAWGHYANAEAEVAEYRSNATAAFVVLDQCADQLQRLQGAVLGPYVPRVIVPEAPFLGRGG